jgi:hypothetical protein
LFDFIPTELYDEMRRNDLLSPPRFPEKIAWHINTKLRGKKIVLYAAGKHTLELFGFLNKDINIVAIVDDNPVVDSICGVRVFKADALSSIVYDVVVISNYFFIKQILNRLSALGVDSKKIFNFYSIDIDSSHYLDFCESLPKITREDKPTILLIVPFENSDHITRFSSLLKENYSLYKVYYLNATYRDKNTNFKEVVRTEITLLPLLKYIEDNRANIDFIVLNTIPGISHIAYFVKKIFPEIKLVITSMDFLTSFGSKNKVVRGLEIADRYDFEKKCEKFMISHADGFISSISGKWAENFLYSKNPKSFQIYNCLSKNIFINIQKQKAQKPLLCYAGGILPTHFDKHISADIKMIKVVVPALESGCRFDVYGTAATTGEQKAFYADYFALADKNTDFRFLPFLPIDELVKKICHADFGVMYYDFSVAKKEKILKHHLESVIPTKVFTYLAAGLPVLISKELKATHEFLMDNGVGISVSQKDIANIKFLIDKADYGRLKENVGIFQSNFCIENKISEMINALEKIRG